MEREKKKGKERRYSNRVRKGTNGEGRKAYLHIALPIVILGKYHWPTGQLPEGKGQAKRKWGGKRGGPLTP